MKLLQEVHIGPKSPARFESLLGRESVAELERTASLLQQRLDGRVIWNVNSTAVGGGVAEMLHSLLAYARGLGVDTRWIVIGGQADFFRITKRLHNALHGDAGDGSNLGKAEREVYRQMTEANAEELCNLVQARDFVILHDPQTAGMLPRLVDRGAYVLWRCHIGNDQRSDEGDRAWAFLAPYIERAHALIFSRFAYVPDFCDHGRSVIVPPSIDPFSPKNQELDEETVRAILVRCGIVTARGDERAPTFTLEDGSPSRVDRRADIATGGPPPSWETPLVVQVSRWDRLKDPVGVLQGFSRIPGFEERSAELVLAGPDVSAVADDPEGVQTFDEVLEAWGALDEPRRRRVHLINLPMEDLEENAAIVNALQRHATVIVQKSLREGFGLTVTEAMWKGRAVVASAVGGIQDQIEHGVSGLLLRDPTDLDAFASCIGKLLDDPEFAGRLGRGARRRASQLYLGLRSLTQYAGLIESLDR